MKTSRLEKTYPELVNLPYNVQLKILERAKLEIFVKEGKALFWGPRLILVSVFIALIIYSILYFIFPLEGWVGPSTGPIVGVLFALVVSKHNIKVLWPKVKELAQKEKLKVC